MRHAGPPAAKPCDAASEERPRRRQRTGHEAEAAGAEARGGGAAEAAGAEARDRTAAAAAAFNAAGAEGMNFIVPFLYRVVHTCT